MHLQPEIKRFDRRRTWTKWEINIPVTGTKLYPLKHQDCHSEKFTSLSRLMVKKITVETITLLLYFIILELGSNLKCGDLLQGESYINLRKYSLYLLFKLAISHSQWLIFKPESVYKKKITKAFATNCMLNFCQFWSLWLIGF